MLCLVLGIVLVIFGLFLKYLDVRVNQLEDQVTKLRMNQGEFDGSKKTMAIKNTVA